MTSDIKVDNKTGTLATFLIDTLSRENLFCFYYS
jgi:hypothetical protein